MIYGIIAAMMEDVSFLLDNVSIKKRFCEFGMKIYIACYKGNDLNIIVSGVGKVNAARGAQYSIAKLNSDVLINIGSAGSILPTLSIGDVVIASSAVQYDADFSAIGLSLGEIPFNPRCSFVYTDPIFTDKFVSAADSLNITNRVGRVLTADLFINNPRFYNLLQMKLDGLSIDAESAAVGQVACLSYIPFGVIRVIVNDSLLPASGAIFEENLDSVVPIPQKILLEFLDNQYKCIL